MPLGSDIILNKNQKKCEYCLWVIRMNRTNSIRIFYAATFLSAGLCFYMGYQMIQDYQEQEKTREYLVSKETEQAETVTEEETELAITNMKIPYEYVIVEEEGYLLVYMQDLETIYMYTNIRLAELSESLQEEIRIGKPFKDLKELYDFLENYSS